MLVLFLLLLLSIVLRLSMSRVGREPSLRLFPTSLLGPWRERGALQFYGKLIVAVGVFVCVVQLRERRPWILGTKRRTYT